MVESFKAKCPLQQDLTLEYVDSSNGKYEFKDKTKLKNYFNEFGYVLQKQVIDEKTCDMLLQAFQSEVLPSKEFIYRQASAKPEKHVFTKHGHILNSILNPQSVHPQIFKSFREKATSLIASQKIQNLLSALMDEPAKAVQSMFFDGNPVTWAHQDCYYLDAESEGAMIGVWIALEDIHPGAGRFYIYPKSKNLDIRKNGGDFDIAFNHERYKKLVKDLIVKFDLKCYAPALKKGDVIFWSSKTIHGSLEAFEPQYSRKSLTCHYIPQSSKFIQFQKIEKTLHLKNRNGVDINIPKDLGIFKNRCIHSLETTFPTGFSMLKKLAIKTLVK